MSGPDNLPKVDRLRARDGDHCWLCGEPLQFKAVPNTSKAPTIEHLIAQSRGGTQSLENLVLCHARCNRLLGDRPLVNKIRLRERRCKKRWLAALRSKLQRAFAAI